MNFTLTKKTARKDVFDSVGAFLKENGFTVIKKDADRPWGGFFVIDESQAEKFKKLFFEEILEKSEVNSNQKLSPKILVVENNKRLSWQYHFRRSEIWKLIGGEAGIVRSDSDAEGPQETMRRGEIVSLTKGERHRLVGLSSWGIIAEIWQHSDKNNPSDEDDIVRVQDDFGR